MDSHGNSCSILLMWKWFPALLLVASPLCAQEQATAYDALRVLANQLGRDFVTHVISVVGVKGTPQPETWKILFDDPRAQGGVREVEIANARIVSQRTPTRTVTGWMGRPPNIRMTS